MSTTSSASTAPRPYAPAPRPSGVAIHCQAVTKSYDAGGTKVHALRGVDLDIRTGELAMLVGPSGCGKTTLISVVAGILDRDGGECRVFGKDFSAMSAREKTRFRGQTVGFVFQQFNLLPALTAAQNVAVPLLINGTARSEAVRRATEMLDRVGLADRAGSLPRQLSGGQQQRVAIARALVHRPRLIVCDEPTSALDHETGHTVMRLLKNVALDADGGPGGGGGAGGGDDGGRALVIVTHDARIFGFADTIAKMDDGRIVETVTSAQGLAQMAAAH